MLPPAIPQNVKTLAISGLVALSSLQQSPSRSHITPVIPISSIFSGLAGRSPEITAWTILARLLTGKGCLPVKIW